MIRSPLRASASSPQRGAASLVVVMVLFFLITLVAAYASRNLLFEQRTSTNQYRSTLAFEAAEAGVEWALARLNDAAMNDNCTPLTSAASVGTQPSFRNRYLGINASTGVVTPQPDPASVTVPPEPRLAGCIFNGAGWTCDCPASGEPSPVVTYTGTGPFPAFWVRFLEVTPVAAGVTGVVRLQVNACTRAEANCLRFNRQAESGDGLATIWSMVTLRSALGSAPAAALTARGPVSRVAGSPTVSNGDEASGGITIHSGGAVDTTGVTLASVPGTPGALTVMANDPTLVFGPLAIVPATPANTGTNRMFHSVFGMWPNTYLGANAGEGQPGLAEVNCAAGCTAADVNDQLTLNPGHAIYLRGAGTLRVEANIGTLAAPVLIVADGSVQFDGPYTIRGLVYSRAATWQLDGAGTIQGAAIAESDFSFLANNPQIVYDAVALQRLRFQYGSFVKVPGGWRDFQP
ncbi:MAG: hypothetical protein HZC37_19400 [Burkholderiales bacterium]|nr:hypothetical protein [Burkholderiales bacterium]